MKRTDEEYFEQKAGQVIMEVDFSDEGRVAVVVRCLKEVARDTRHACAEAVLLGADGNGLIDASFAQAACLNASVLERVDTEAGTTD